MFKYPVQVCFILHIYFHNDSLLIHFIFPNLYITCTNYDLKVAAPYLIPLLLKDQDFAQELLPLKLPRDWHSAHLHPLGDYAHLERETLPQAGDISVIKQQGAYTNFKYGWLLDFKDVYKFCSHLSCVCTWLKRSKDTSPTSG